MGWGPFGFLKKALGAVFATVLFAASLAIGNPLTFFGAIKSWKALFVFGSSLVLSAFAGRRPNLDLPDTSQSVTGTNEPAKTIYGEVVVGGLLADIQEIPNVSYRHYKSYVCRYAICDKKPGFTYEVVDVEVGGEWLQATAETLKQAPAGDTRVMGANGTGTALSSDFQFLKPYAQSDYVGSHILDVVAGYGAATETVRDTIQFGQDFDDSGWTGEGLIWAVVTFGTGDSALEQFQEKRVSAQTVRFRVKALLTGKTKSNPAEVLKQHLKNEMGLADARIDSASFTSTATVCNTRNYSCDGIMRAGQEYEAIGWILQTCEGALVQDSGKFYLKGLDNPASRFTITEDMLIEEPEIQHSIAWRERYNHIRAEIIDKDKEWTRQSTAEIDDPGAYSEDGNVKFMLDLGGLNFVNTQSHANRILVEELARRRHGRNIGLVVHHSDVTGIKAYDNVTLNLVKNGVTGVWRVINVIHAIEGDVQLSLTSEAGVSGLDTRFQTLPATTGLTATVRDQYSVRLSWTRIIPTYLVREWQYRVKQTRATTWGGWNPIPGATPVNASGVVSLLTPGTAYDFQVRARAGSAFGAASNTASATTLSDLLAPSGITITNNANGSVTVGFTRPATFTAWEVRYYRVSTRGPWSSWRRTSLSHQQTLAASLFVAGSYIFDLRLINQAGQTGTQARVTFTVTGATAPPVSQVPGVCTRLSVQVFAGTTNVYRLYWRPPTTGGAVSSYDVAATVTSSAPTSWINAGEATRYQADRYFDFQQPQNARYFWVRARNSAGHGSAASVRRSA